MLQDQNADLQQRLDAQDRRLAGIEGPRRQTLPAVGTQAPLGKHSLYGARATAR